MIRCQSATLLGLSLEDLPARTRAFEQALQYARESSVSHISIFTYACWAYLLVLLGRLHEAHAVCTETLRLAHFANSIQPLPTLCHVYATLSMILLEWNDLEGALRTARQAVEIARRWEQADALHFAYTNLGEALFACGNVKEAFRVLHEAGQLAQRTSIWFEEITLAQEIDWHVLQGNPEAALQRLRSTGLENEQPSGGSRRSIAMLGTRAEVFLARKEYARALEEIAPVLDSMEKRGDVYYYVKSLVWQAKAYAGLGQKTQALVSLKKALSLAAREGYVRVFLAGGGDSLTLLHLAQAAGILPEYIDRLLASLEGAGKPPVSLPVANSLLIEPLSKREFEVIALLAQGCSDKSIAGNLVIARETVHKHLKNIYAKLGVHSRTEAIARAHELGLL
jgi:LuxR family maltose regulon positive regulatory protein